MSIYIPDFRIQHMLHPLLHYLNWVYVCMLAGWVTSKCYFHLWKESLPILKVGLFRVCFHLSENVVSHYELILGWSTPPSVPGAVVQGPMHQLAMCGESRSQAVPMSPGKHKTQRYVRKVGRWTQQSIQVWDVSVCIIGVQTSYSTFLSGCIKKLVISLVILFKEILVHAPVENWKVSLF